MYFRVAKNGMACLSIKADGMRACNSINNRIFYMKLFSLITLLIASASAQQQSSSLSDNELDFLVLMTGLKFNACLKKDAPQLSTASDALTGCRPEDWACICPKFTKTVEKIIPVNMREPSCSEAEFISLRTDYTAVLAKKFCKGFPVDTETDAGNPKSASNDAITLIKSNLMLAGLLAPLFM